MKHRPAWRRDIGLYGLIGGLTAMQTYIGAGDLPKPWGPWVGILLAALVAIKAKLSNGHPDPNNEGKE